MKGGTVQINWHDVQPVLTLDFHYPSGLLATGGNDHDIKTKRATQELAEPTNLKPEFVDNMDVDKVETTIFVGQTEPMVSEASQVVSPPTQNTDASKAPKKKRITPIAII